MPGLGQLQSHYYNKLPDGQALDLTLTQYGSEVKIESQKEIRSREFVLSYPDTQRRYALLRSRLEDAAIVGRVK